MNRAATRCVAVAFGIALAGVRAVIAIDPCGCAASGDIPTASVTLRLSHPEHTGRRLMFTVMTLAHVKPLPGKHIRKPGIDGYPTRWRLAWSSSKTYLWLNPGF